VAGCIVAAIFIPDEKPDKEAKEKSPVVVEDEFVVPEIIGDDTEDEDAIPPDELVKDTASEPTEEYSMDDLPGVEVDEEI
jgi:hypothetical protein